MTPGEIRAFVDQYVRAWQRQDVEALLGCYTPDCEVVSPMFHAVQGQASIRQTFEALFRAFGDITITVDDIVIDAGPPSRAVLVLRTHATHVGDMFGFPASGRRVDVSIVYVLKFEGNRIGSETRVYDFTGLLIQLGVLRAKGM